MTPNRVVAILTPILAPAVGLASKWLVENTGVSIPAEDLNAVFIGGTLAALAPAIQWLHGWQKHEAREAEIQRDVAIASVSAIPEAADPVDISGELDEEYDEYDDGYDDFEGYDDYEGYDDSDEYVDEDEVQLGEPAPAVT